MNACCVGAQVAVAHMTVLTAEVGWAGCSSEWQGPGVTRPNLSESKCSQALVGTPEHEQVWLFVVMMMAGTSAMRGRGWQPEAANLSKAPPCELCAPCPPLPPLV